MANGYDLGPPRIDFFRMLTGIGDTFEGSYDAAAKSATRRRLGAALNDPNADPRALAGKAIGAGMDDLGGLFMRSAERRDTAKADAAAMAGLAGLWNGGGGGSALERLAGGAPRAAAAAAPGAPGDIPDVENMPRTLLPSESGGWWDAQNNVPGAGGTGHFGRAQFSRARIQEAIDAGALPQGTTPETFMGSPQLQRSAERWHFNDIDAAITARGLDKAVGTTINGVPVTIDGMRAVAHLGGMGGLTRFIKSGGAYNPADANGTSLLDYLGKHASNRPMGPGEAPTITAGNDDEVAQAEIATGMVPRDFYGSGEGRTVQSGVSLGPRGAQAGGQPPAQLAQAGTSDAPLPGLGAVPRVQELPYRAAGTGRSTPEGVEGSGSDLVRSATPGQPAPERAPVNPNNPNTWHTVADVPPAVSQGLSKAKIPYLVQLAASPNLSPGIREVAKSFLATALNEGKMPEAYKEWHWARANGQTTKTFEEWKTLGREPKDDPGETITKQTAARRAEADRMGLPEGPERNQYVLTGKLGPDEKLDRKAIGEADSTVTATQNALDSIREARRLSPQAFDGFGASLRGETAANFGHAGGTATMELDNVLKGSVLAGLKAAFGSNPTEGERKIALEVAGSVNQPRPVRDAIFKRAEEAILKRHREAEAKAAELRDRSYYRPGGGTTRASGGEGGQPRGQAEPVAVPTGAVEMLRADPSLAAHFDAKYGAGASRRYLGQ